PNVCCRLRPLDRRRLLFTLTYLYSYTDGDMITDRLPISGKAVGAERPRATLTWMSRSMIVQLQIVPCRGTFGCPRVASAVTEDPHLSEKAGLPRRWYHWSPHHCSRVSKIQSR